MGWYWLIVAHMAGDYVFQSDWMAQTKTKESVPALAHATVYTLCFALVVPSWQALALIGVTHFIIDRWRLARYVCWIKNFLSPPFTWGVAFHDDCAPGAIGYYARPGSHFEAVVDAGIERGTTVDGYTGWYWVRRAKKWIHPWSECSGTGYHKDSPPWMSVWLMIIADNTMHLSINGLAFYLYETGVF